METLKLVNMYNGVLFYTKYYPVRYLDIDEPHM